LSVEEIVTNSETAMNSLDSYALDMDLLISGENPQSPEAGEMAIRLESSSKLDIMNKRMYTSGTMDMEGMSMPMETYIIGNMQYSKAPMAGWVKQEAEMSWDDLAEAGKISMVGNANLTLEGGEVVDGVDCYVITTVPTAETILKIFSQEIGGSGSMGDAKSFLESVKSMTSKEWISKSDFRLRKTHITVDLESEGSPISVEITMRVYDFNEPMNIKLSEEAKNARDMSPMGGRI